MAADSVAIAPAPPAQPPTPSKDELLIKLDESLERYLHTLDNYQQAQQKLTSHLSAGYFSLAQANFSNATRTRYGQDYYDERMRALRKVTATDIQGSRISFSVAVPDPSKQKKNIVESSEEKPSPSEKPDSDSSAEPAGFETATGPEFDDKGKSQTTNGTEGKDDHDASSKKEEAETQQEELPKDPIRWFGILVPQTLRAAQRSFVETVEGPVPLMATLMAELRLQEIEIGRLRKQIRKL